MANEKRLIDANALITTIQGTESEVARNAPYDAEWFTRMADRQFEILGMIDNAPTVDAVEVKRGRWIEFNTFMTCSVCDKDWYYGDNNCDEFDYCPNCGAKMDKNENP